MSMEYNPLNLSSREIGSGPHPLSYTAYPLANGPIYESIIDLDSAMDFDKELAKKNKQEDLNSIYIHIPFCEHFCNFCCYFKVPKEQKLVNKYLNSLKREIKLYSETEFIQSSIFSTLYFGGGTPTSLSCPQLVDLLDFCFDNICLAADAIVTIEGCTYNYDKEKLNETLSHGANRVSFGVQTFQDSIRKLLNLKDTSLEAIKAINNAHKAGFEQVDIDLLYNLPTQKIEECVSDVEIAIDIGVESITLFPLAIYPESSIYNKINVGDIKGQINTEKEIEMYLKSKDTLIEAGYIQKSYTQFLSSSKIKRNRISDNCLACGTVAEGSFGKYAYKNTLSLEKYFDALNNYRFPISELVSVSKDNEMRRYIIINLLQLKIDINDFEKKFNLKPQDAYPQIFREFIDKGLILESENELKLSHIGTAWGDNICRAFCDSD